MDKYIGSDIDQPVGTLDEIKHKDPDKLLKQAIWAYFLLVIFEGALRKWFLTGLATPLLVIRDPIAIWLVYTCWQKGILPSTIYLKGMVVVGLISIYTAVFTGHGNFFVALFGARIFLFHIPLMFVIGRIFTREDILDIGKATIWMTVPMVILIGLQFYSPQSAWVNRGVGGDEAGAGFSGSSEYLRPPATFSFTNGTAYFFGWVAPFVFYFWLNSKNINRLLLIAASGALIAAIPLTISRTVFFSVCLTGLFTGIAILRKPQYLGKMMVAMLALVVVLAVLSQTSFFQTATGAFTERFDSANEQEGGLVKGVIGDRFLGGLLGALTESSEQPFFGYGVGMGTNVGAMLLTGTQTFLISEGEWGRIIGELGPVMGLFVVILRITFTIKIASLSYKSMIKGDLLPWILLSFGFINIAQGGWSQPTSLGFIVMIGGLILASLNSKEEEAVKTIE